MGTYTVYYETIENSNRENCKSYDKFMIIKNQISTILKADGNLDNHDNHANLYNRSHLSHDFSLINIELPKKFFVT